MSGVYCDEFNMVITSTYGRDNYTAFGKALLMGDDGLNYGLNNYCTWSSPSRIYQAHTRQWHPSILGNEHPQKHGNEGFVCFDDHSGRKVVNWSSKIGSVRLMRFMIHTRSSAGSEWCRKDFPKDVAFEFKRNGLVVHRVNHQYGNRWDNRDPNNQEETEWVEFNCSHYGLTKFGKEEEERLEWICEQFDGDIKFTFANKQEVNLWKCFLINSEIFNEKLRNSEEYTGMSDLVLHLEEKCILSLLVQKRVDIPVESLFDYFQFFRHLGLKKEMKILIDYIPEIDEFLPLYSIFKKTFLDEFGKKKLGSKITCDSFDTSFTLALFLHLGDRLPGERQNNPLELKCLEYYDWIEHHVGLLNQEEEEEDDEEDLGTLRKKIRMINVLQHKDFEGIESDADFQDVNDQLFRKLYTVERDRTSNVRLLSSSSDGSKKESYFLCHKEILVLRFGYFMRMFGSNWAEREALEKNQAIRIESIQNEGVMETFLHYLYLHDLSNPEFGMEVLIHLLMLSQMYIADDLRKCCLARLDRMIVEKKDQEEGFLETRKKLNQVLENLCSLLYVNEEVTELVIPRLSEYYGVKETWIYQKILSMEDRKVMVMKFKEFEDTVIKELKEENMKLKERILVLEKRSEEKKCKKKD